MMINHGQRRAQILTTAQQLFAEHGFASTTTRQLNQTVGIADGLLYYYFPQGKQQLLDTIVAQGVTAHRAAIDLSLAGVADLPALEARLVAIMQQLWDLLTSPEGYQVFVITIRERPRLSQAAADWLPKVMTQGRKRLMTALNQLAWLKLDPADSKQLATTIFAVFQATLYSALLINDQRELTAAVSDQLHAQLHFLLTKVTA
ncbi:TetR/AcrR family transcriptional regulator [Lacticaseibacillus jixiensis]|uniref:TetR/AcrR family transcriptional regulator n=1 Tax=Lacticaseibacillus jixiensis TaxID=3231926 RepID=UPI0036F2DE5E